MADKKTKRDDDLMGAYMDNLSKKSTVKQGDPVSAAFNDSQENVELSIAEKGIVRDQSANLNKLNKSMKEEMEALQALSDSRKASAQRSYALKSSASPFRKETTKEEEDMLAEKAKMRELEKDYLRRKEEKAKDFTEKMGKATTMMEAKREENKTQLLKRAKNFQSRLQERKKRAIDQINKEKRELISERMEEMRENSAKRTIDIKRKHQEFEFLKNTLPPTLDVIKQEEIENRRDAIFDQGVKVRHEKMKPMDMGAILNHEANFTLSLKRREIDNAMRSSTSEDHTAPIFDPALFQKNRENVYFQKKSLFLQNHARSMMYAESVRSKVELRSPNSAIDDWMNYQKKSNFGFYYKQQVMDRVEHNKHNLDPNSFMVEGIDRAKRNQLNKSAAPNAQSMKSLQSSPDNSSKHIKNYKEFLTDKIDYTKVNDLSIPNMKLNEYERAERAKTLMKEGNKKTRIEIDAKVTNIKEATSEYLNSQSPNVFKRYMGTLEYLDKQAADKERLEKYAKQGNSMPTISKINQKDADSLDLLSQSIQSKIQVLTKLKTNK